MNTTPKKGGRMSKNKKYKIKQGLEQGIEKGIEQGLEQGLEQGKKEANKQVVISMLNKGLDINTIPEKGRKPEEKTHKTEKVSFRK